MYRSPISVLEEEDVFLAWQPTAWEVKDEQEEFIWTRAAFPSPGSWTRDNTLQSSILFLVVACFSRLAGRVQWPVATAWSVVIPLGQQRSVAFL